MYDEESIETEAESLSFSVESSESTWMRLGWSDTAVKHGSHASFGEGSCALEWVDAIARVQRGQRVSSTTRLTDRPDCVCPVLRAFVLGWNDGLSKSVDGDRQRTKILGPVLPRLVCTRGTREVERRRAMLCVDWIVRTWLPAWLDVAKLREHASVLRVLTELTRVEDLIAAHPRLVGAQNAVKAVRTACSGGFSLLSWDAARAAAWDAAWAAAGAAGAADGDADDAAWTGVWNLAMTTADLATPADVAWTVVSPTVVQLQNSALELLDRMLAVV